MNHHIEKRKGKYFSNKHKVTTRSISNLSNVVTSRSCTQEIKEEIQPDDSIFNMLWQDTLKGNG